jgi:CheY-like chemotaxis protein
MTKQPKIMLVDDDPDFVDATVRILKTTPYQIITARDGEEGIQKIKKEKPDLILLDIMMPEKNGYSVADEVKNDPAVSDIPILALTSVVEVFGPPPFPFKVSEYLQKNIKPAELIDMVNKYLKK